jgi:hypothetical protein
MKFNSQICTSREQSERLLALGLKKETADCYLFEYDKEKYKVIAESWLDLIADEKYYSQYKDVCFPAWSLHRLIEIMDVTFQTSGRYVLLEEVFFVRSENFYDNVIDCIEWLIKEGYLPKEYLV